jgi:hypothetical protein
MIRVLIKPVKRIFSKNQWTWEIRGGNGARIDPRDTYHNRIDAIGIMESVFGRDDAAELVIYDEHGEVEERRDLR